MLSNNTVNVIFFSFCKEYAMYTHFLDKRHVVGLDLLNINVNFALAV